jgi:hypothetical protein
MSFLCGPCRGVILKTTGRPRQSPCGGGVEYLHRDPASRRRRRQGKSQIWNNKIWSRVPRDSDLRKIALARASSIYKRQIHPPVREGAPQKQDRTWQRLISGHEAQMGLDSKTYWLTDWLTVSRNLTLTLTWPRQTKDRPVLSSKRAPHNNKTVTVKQQ